MPLDTLLHSLGVQKGDRVALLLDNSLELRDLHHAAAKTGIVVVPRASSPTRARSSSAARS